MKKKLSQIKLEEKLSGYDLVGVCEYIAALLSKQKDYSGLKSIFADAITHLKVSIERNEIAKPFTVLIFKRGGQVYIVLKHAFGGGIIMSQDAFSKQCPGAYDTLATYSDKFGKFIGDHFNNIDAKLGDLLGSKYNTFEYHSKKIFAEVDKNAPL